MLRGFSIVLCFTLGASGCTSSPKRNIPNVPFKEHQRDYVARKQYEARFGKPEEKEDAQGISFAEYRAKQIEERERYRKIDALWKAGYGYNNPNNDLRDGEKPETFGGRREKKSGIFDNLVGDFIGYKINKAFD